MLFVAIHRCCYNIFISYLEVVGILKLFLSILSVNRRNEALGSWSLIVGEISPANKKPAYAFFKQALLFYGNLDHNCKNEPPVI